MLVMTRKVGERIVIGDNVTVTVVRISGGMVRLGIEAPQDYAVFRRELTGAGENEPLSRAPSHGAEDSSRRPGP
jgi:carbon storage regulator